MEMRRGAVRAAAAVGLALSALATAAPAQAQSYGATKVDCYVSSVNSGPLKVNRFNDVIVRGGNEGSKAATCRVSIKIRKVGTTTYGQVTGAVGVFTPVGGKFTVHFGVKPMSPGQWRITACARGPRVDSVDFADDCRSITRTAS